MPETDGTQPNRWPLRNGSTWTIFPDRTQADDHIHLWLKVHDPKPVGGPHQFESAGQTGWISIEGVTQVILDGQRRELKANLLIYDRDEARALANALLEAIEEQRPTPRAVSGGQ